MRSIHERAVPANDRSEFGHWKADSRAQGDRLFMLRLILFRAQAETGHEAAGDRCFSVLQGERICRQ
jgi:hypothetical protein